MLSLVRVTICKRRGKIIDGNEPLTTPLCRHVTERQFMLRTSGLLFVAPLNIRHAYVVGTWNIPIEHKALFIHIETFVLPHLSFQYIQSIVEHKAEPRLAMPRFLCPRIALKTSGIACPHLSGNSFSI